MKDHHKYLSLYLFLVVTLKAYALENQNALELLSNYTETQNKMQSVIVNFRTF